jgi:hypothetical protein
LLEALVHAANCLDLFETVALPLRDFDHQVVSKNATWRYIAALGLSSPPHPKLADDRQAA